MTLATVARLSFITRLHKLLTRLIFLQKKKLQKLSIYWERGIMRQIEASNATVLEQYDKIGGWLWLPAFWTVTNVLIAGWLITIVPKIGWITMGFAIANVYLFWTRSVVYRWYFMVQTVSALVLLAAISGTSAGGGNVIDLMFMFYVLFSKRSRGTFTQPLFRKSAKAPIP